jgi:hypothetical protein
VPLAYPSRAPRPIFSTEPSEECDGQHGDQLFRYQGKMGDTVIDWA